jgi:glycosyltransferase involved in cell wall biosynthesis
MPQPFITKPVLIYLPAYNCATIAADVVRSIPLMFAGRAEAILIDNASPDNTAEAVEKSLATNPGPVPCHVLRARRNLGYAGSQKLAYEIALANPGVEHVIMLHGDGQYPPELATEFLKECSGGADIVYGYRSKLRYRRLEETPLLTFGVIRVLSIMESIVTTTFRKEWHTGYIMYRTRFLRKVPLQVLTETPHIDGHLLYAGGRLGATVKGIPIFKRYKNFIAFSGVERARYVVNVFRLMFSFRSITLAGVAPTKIYTERDFEIVGGPAK